MNEKLKKILSAALVGCMVIGSVPAAVLAEEEAAVVEIASEPAEAPAEEAAMPVVLAEEEAPAPEDEPAPASESAEDNEPEPAAEDVDAGEPAPAENTEPEPAEEPAENTQPVPTEDTQPEADPSTEPEPTDAPADVPAQEPSTEPSVEPDATVEASPSASPEAVPSVTPEVSPTITPEASPTAAPEAGVITGFDLTALPQHVLVAYGTAQEALGLPAALTAVYLDGSTAETAVSWVCISDGLGGTAYVPQHTNPAVVYTFQAVLAADIPCLAQLPVLQVAYASMPAPAEITQLVITEQVNLDDIDLTLHSDILVEAGGEIIGGETDLPVVNKGVITLGVFNGEVVNTKGSLIRGGEFNALVTNEAEAIIEMGVFCLSVLNEGIIENGEFTGFVPEEPVIDPNATPEPTPTPDPEATPAPEEEEIIVEIENKGEILDGVFTHCKITNLSEGEISGGVYADAVILPDGSTAALDFENTHMLLKGGTLYFKTLEFAAEIDYINRMLDIRPLNRVYRLDSYVVNGADWQLSGEWAAAEDGAMHLPMDESFKSGAATVALGYLNAEDGASITAQVQIEIPSYFAGLASALDYVGESLSVTVTEALADGWTLSIVKTVPAAEEGAEPTLVTTELAWPENSDTAMFALKDMGLAPDNADNIAAQLQLKHVLLGETGKLNVEIPMRPAYSGKEAGLKGTYKTATELQLTCAEGLETALGLPDTDVNTLLPGSLYSDLLEKTTYYIWVRDAAVADVSFASQWNVVNQVTVSGYTQVSFSPNELSVVWSPKLSSPAITFNHTSVDADDCVYTWTDSNGKTQTKAPTDVGSYDIQVSLKESKLKFYQLTGETGLDYTITPLEMTTKNATVSCESITYNGKEQLPQKLVVRINGNKVDADEFTIEKVSGQDYVSAGTKVIKITGKGNVTGTISASYKIAAGSSGSSSGGSSSGGSSSGGSSSGGSSSGGSSSGGSSSGSGTGNLDTDTYSWEDDVTTITDSGENLHADYLGANADDESMNQLSIVRDELGRSMSYELLPVYQPLKESDTTTNPDNTMLVIAQTDDFGEYAPRILCLGLDQIRFLHQDKEMSSILYRNGDAELYLRCEELYTGRMAKLANYMISTQAEAVDLAALDLEAMLDVELSDEQLEQVRLEARISPVLLPDEEIAWDISLWLCRDDVQVEISRLMQGMVICLNVTGMFDEDDKASFTQNWGIVQVENDPEADVVKTLRQLKSILLRFPSAAAIGVDDICGYYDVIYPSVEEFPEEDDFADEIIGAEISDEEEFDEDELVVDYTSAVEIDFYRNDILATVYAGEGAYLLVDLENDESLNV